METKVRESIKKINLKGTLAFQEPMDRHCTFRVGGPADLFLRPADYEDLRSALAWARDQDLPVFVLGGGANIVPADRGIRGLVVDLTSLGTWQFEGSLLRVQAGAMVSQIAAAAADAGLGGLDFIYAMPGSTGGAAYMNARCYDGEMSQVLIAATWLEPDLSLVRGTFTPADFSYKVSPFTGSSRIILELELGLHPADPAVLWPRMHSLEADRRAKGHFAFPCAGSVFKNDHSLGAPSGRIIDSIGLRGLSTGGARVSDQHANIIVNTGTATATDIRTLTDTVAARVLTELGHRLESEILFVGDWSDYRGV